MTDSTGMEGIIDRIAKLKGLAANPGTEAEAAAAVAAIQKLMLKHDLTDFDVEQAKQTLRSSLGMMIINVPAANWRRVLINSIGAVSRVQVVFSIPETAVSIFGEHQHCLAAKGLYEYLAAVCDRIAVEQWWEQPAAVRRATTRRIWCNAFRVGMAERLSQRLREEYNRALAEENHGAALVVVYRDSINDYIQKTMGPTAPVQIGASHSDRRAKERGFAAAEHVSLAKQIG